MIFSPILRVRERDFQVDGSLVEGKLGVHICSIKKKSTTRTVFVDNQSVVNMILFQHSEYMQKFVQDYCGSRRTFEHQMGVC